MAATRLETTLRARRSRTDGLWRLVNAWFLGATTVFRVARDASDGKGGSSRLEKRARTPEAVDVRCVDSDELKGFISSDEARVERPEVCIRLCGDGNSTSGAGLFTRVGFVRASSRSEDFWIALL
jgi:hypothetical protein